MHSSIGRLSGEGSMWKAGRGYTGRSSGTLFGMPALGFLLGGSSLGLMYFGWDGWAVL